MGVCANTANAECGYYVVSKADRMNPERMNAERMPDHAPGLPDRTDARHAPAIPQSPLGCTGPSCREQRVPTPPMPGGEWKLELRIPDAMFAADFVDGSSTKPGFSRMGDSLAMPAFKSRIDRPPKIETALL